MAALTADKQIRTRDGGHAIRVAKASTAFFAGGFVQDEDANGDVIPLTTSAGRFGGIANEPKLAATADRRLEVSLKGKFLATISSVAKADIGKPVYCATDNPADVSLTPAANSKLIGYVSDLESDKSGTGTFEANKCWVKYDVDEATVASPRSYALSGATMNILPVMCNGSLVTTSHTTTATVNLPAGFQGARVTIKKIDANAAEHTIDGNSSETIDGSATYTSVNAENDVVQLAWDEVAGEWAVVGGIIA